MFGIYGDILVVTVRGGSATSIWWLEARAAAKHLATYRTAPFPPTKNSTVPNVSGAYVKKPCNKDIIVKDTM